jgi:predicted nucleotidyltransferase
MVLSMAIDGVREWAAARPVRLVLLFGSQADGRAHAASDVDLAVWPDGAPAAADKLQWLLELQTIFGRDVSLVLVSPRLDPVLGLEIVRHGVVLYEREPRLWHWARLDLWHAYNDSLPFLRAQRRSLREWAEELRRGP